MDLSKIYFDSNGKKGNILQIVALEPEWAAKRIQDGEKAIARITDLEAQLTAAQERNTKLQSEHLDHVIALHDQLTAMTAERDSETRWAKQYSDERRSMARRRRSEMEYSLIATEPDGSKWVMIEESERIIADLKAELRAKENTIKSKNKLIEKLVEQLTAAQEREAAYAEYKRKLEAIVMWLERRLWGSL